MFIGMLFFFYIVIGLCLAIMIADLGHRRKPKLSEWIVGLMWLPVIALIVVMRLKHKK